MKKLFELAVNNWPRLLALNIAAGLLFWAIGCEATVPSLTRPGSKLTRAELNLELENLLATYELRSAELEQQERLRQLILNNALLIAQAGTVNPLGIITAIAAFYGAGSAVKDTKNIVKKRLNKNSNS